jgi:hypothetical protein
MRREKNYLSYILPKGGHQESNLEATITKDGDPHQLTPTGATMATPLHYL